MNRPVAIFLILAASAAAMLILPLHTGRSAPVFAIPRPTPPDKQAIDALVEQLMGTLGDSIDDDDLIASIGRKWDARILAGKTKKQIIDLLYADLKSVVTEKETQDAVWKSWADIISDAVSEDSTPANTSNAGVQPPAAPVRSVSFDDPTERGIAVPRVGGQWILTDDLKRTNAASEMAFFRSAYTAVKVWRPEKRQYGGFSYTVLVATDPLDQNAQGKITGADKAVKAVIDHGFILPNDLRFYCSNVVGTLTQAFKRGDNWAPIAWIVLGDGGSTKALSATSAGLNGFDTRTIRAIHEIGHILHERYEGDGFWEKGRTPNPAVSAKVSAYGCCNEKEFVAEVFTGLMIGVRWPPDVIAEYHRFHGPMP